MSKVPFVYYRFNYVGAACRLCLPFFHLSNACNFFEAKEYPKYESTTYEMISGNRISTEQVHALQSIITISTRQSHFLLAREPMVLLNGSQRDLWMDRIHHCCSVCIPNRRLRREVGLETLGRTGHFPDIDTIHHILLQRMYIKKLKRLRVHHG